MKKLSLYIFLVLLMISACSEQNQLSECIEGDCNNGYGTATTNSGIKYVGEFKDGVGHGQGTFTYESGDKYVGEYKDGKRNGQGTYTWADGAKYVGGWKEDKRHGQGTYTRADGTVKKGKWKNGDFVNANADMLEKFTLSCEGTAIKKLYLDGNLHRTRNDIFYEDYEIQIDSTGIWAVKIINTTLDFNRLHFYARNTKYQEDDPDSPILLTVSEDNLVLGLAAPDRPPEPESIKKPHGGLSLKNARFRISLQSGTTSGHMLAQKIELGISWDISWRAKCNGVQKILAALNKNDGTKGIGGSSGTAFFINNKGNLITNHHVVEGCKSQKINYFTKKHDVQIVSTDKSLDLALLKAKVRPKSFITFSRDEPKKRQVITAAGYPLGKYLSDDLKINDGRISALKGFKNNTNQIQHDIAINPGNSGGPIVNENGQLVAIAVSGMSKDVTEGLNFGIKASAVASFLKSNKISPSKGYMNFSMSDDKLIELLEESTVYTFCP